MGNLDTFYQAQEIEHLPDARGKSATQMSQQDLPVFDRKGMLETVAGMSIFLNAFLIMILVVVFIITIVR